MQRFGNIFRAFVLLGFAVLVPLTPAQGQTEYVRLSIPAKPMAEALIEFAIQSRLSISVSGVDFGDTISQPLVGTFQKDDALRRLLARSAFDFEYVDSMTVRIRRAEPADSRVSRQEPMVETILVTATKRQQTKQNLPYSIAVTTGRQLEDFGVETSHGLTSQVAGLTTTNLGSGEDKLFVRGLTDSILPGLSESVVGVYLDESRIVDGAPDPNIRLIDIDRVEVLRGPQGSLYGAGSLSGLVRIVTNKPDFNSVAIMAQTSVSSTEHGGVSTNFGGMFNLPLVSDVLALRIVGYDDDQAGYIDEMRLHLSNTNRTQTNGGRAQLGWQPDAAWNVIASLAVQNTNAADSQYYLKSLVPQTRDNFLLEPHSDNFAQAGITANGALGWANIVTSTSFVGRHLENRFDASYAWPQLTGFPLGPSPFDYTRKIQSFTHETRLSSTGDGPWKWLAGLFLAHRDEDFQSSLTGPDATGETVVARAEAREDRANEAALFGEVTYDFTSEWSLTAGARIFDSSRKVSARGSGFLFSPSDTFNGTNSQTGVAPKAVLEYRPSTRMTFYAQYSEGYRLGGLGADGPSGGSGLENRFASDELHNYELGSKLSFLAGRASVDAATYFVTWDKVQTDQIAPDGAFYILNAGTVHDAGLEVELASRPFENMSVQANAFWNNASLSKTNPLLANGEGVLPGAPDVTASLSGRYEFRIDQSDDGFASLNYSYVGVSHLGFGESTQTMGGYRLAGVRAGVARGPWQLVLFVDNLTNDRGNTFAFGNPFDLNRGPQVTPPHPRTVGVSLTWSR